MFSFKSLVNDNGEVKFDWCSNMKGNVNQNYCKFLLTLKVLVTTTAALGHFETG